jgi:hypothetical protein
MRDIVITYWPVAIFTPILTISIAHYRSRKHQFYICLCKIRLCAKWCHGMVNDPVNDCDGRVRAQLFGAYAVFATLDPAIRTKNVEATL